MIAIILHIYYVELWQIFAEKLKKLNTKFDLYITLTKGNQDITDDILKSFPDAKIYTYINKGMDIGPFLLTLKKIRNKNYNYIIKLHTKNNGNNLEKNKILEEISRKPIVQQNGYNKSTEDSLNYLIGSDEQIQKNIHFLDKNNYKMLGLKTYVQNKYNKWYAFIPYSFFMVDFKVLMQIYTDKLIDKRYEPMPTEYYTEGTPTHLQERQFGQDLIDNNYSIYGKDYTMFYKIEIVGHTFNDTQTSAMGSYNPLFPNYYKDKKLLHYRGDSLMQNEPISIKTESTPLIKDNLFWCGLYHNHFGHTMAEFSSRILPYKELNLKGKLCFSKKPNQEINNFFWELIEHFGFQKDDVIFVEDCIIAKKLFCLPEQENLWQKNFTSESYLNMLDKNSPPIPYEDKKKIYYISRTKIGMGKGNLAGELYLEQYFKSKGIEIVYPEQLSFSKQLEIYKNAKTLIFCSGSSIFGMLALGRVNCNVIIICRTNIGPNSKNFPASKLLIPRIRKLKVFEFKGEVTQFYKFKNNPRKGNKSLFVPKITQNDINEINTELYEMHGLDTNDVEFSFEKLKKQIETDISISNKEE